MFGMDFAINRLAVDCSIVNQSNADEVADAARRFRPLIWIHMVFLDLKMMTVADGHCRCWFAVIRLALQFLVWIWRQQEQLFGWPRKAPSGVSVFTGVHVCSFQ